MQKMDSDRSEIFWKETKEQRENAKSKQPERLEWIPPQGFGQSTKQIWKQSISAFSLTMGAGRFNGKMRLGTREQPSHLGWDGVLELASQTTATSLYSLACSQWRRVKIPFKLFVLLPTQSSRNFHDMGWIRRASTIQWSGSRSQWSVPFLICVRLVTREACVDISLEGEHHRVVSDVSYFTNDASSVRILIWSFLIVKS